MNCKLSFVLSCCIPLLACSQKPTNKFEALQGKWRYWDSYKFTDDDGAIDFYYTPSFYYKEFLGDTCIDIDNVQTAYDKPSSSRIYFSNRCPKDEDDSIKENEIDNVGGEYLILNGYCTEISFQEDTLKIYYPHARRPRMAKWVRIKQIPKSKLITVEKSNIYSEPNKVTNKYLEKDDQVELLADSLGWLKIRFYGKKTTEGWIKKEDVEQIREKAKPSPTPPAAPPAKTARLLSLEAACKSSGLTLVLAQTSEGTTFLINKGDKPLNYFIVQLPSRKQTLGFLTESLRGVEQHFIDDVEAGKVKFNAVSDANGKPVKDRQGFVLNYLTLPSGREAWAFVKQN